MTRTLKLLGPQARDLLPMFVTVDPAHDTVEVMRAYVSHFDPRIAGLTGSESAVSAAQRAFNVSATRKSSDVPVDHSLFIYFAGPDGKVLKTFHASQSADEIASEVRTYMKKRA
jgi:protein SCO1/2